MSGDDEDDTSLAFYDQFIQPERGDQRPSAGGSAPDVADEEARIFGFEHVVRLREMAEALRKRRGIEQVHLELHDPVPQVVLEALEDGLGLRLPPQITSLYRQTDGFEFRWQWRDDEGQLRPGGAVRMVGFSTVFGNWLGTLWDEVEGVDPARLDFIWQLRGIDDTPGDSPPGTTPMTVMQMEEEAPSYRLYLHDLEGGSYPLDLDLYGYVEAALETRGILGWQLLFCTGYDLDEDPLGLGTPEQVYEQIDRFFPDVNLSRFYALP